VVAVEQEERESQGRSTLKLGAMPRFCSRPVRRYLKTAARLTPENWEQVGEQIGNRTPHNIVKYRQPGTT
jgi:hypothetical protein